MKYYLSGAITKQPEFKKYFKEHEEELRSLGLNDIFNPAAIDWPENVKWETCMKYDIQELMKSDWLVLLPNWKGSRGVKLEVLLCKKLGIKIIKFKKLIKLLTAN